MRLGRKACILSLWFILVADCAFGQWIPVTARVRDTFVATVNGKVLGVEKKEGFFHRSSNGSTLYVWLDVWGGTMKPAVGQLIDNQKHLMYNLDYVRLEARQIRQIGPKPLSDPSNVKDFGMGQEYIEGIRCVVTPIYFMTKDQVIGKTCYASQYGLALREDATWTYKGQTNHHTSDMYDIKLGTEPDSSLFNLERYTVYRPSQPNPH
jgi:hypothetical protein